MATASYLRLGANDLILQYGEPGVAVIQFGPNLRIIPNNVGMKTINYRGPAGTFPHYSMADVVKNKIAPESSMTSLFSWAQRRPASAT